MGGSIFGSSSTSKTSNFLKNKNFIFNFSKFLGGNGLVCEGERTCCPANVESALRHSAASDFHHAVRQSSHQLRHTLTQSSTAIQGENPNSNRRERVGKIKNKKQTCLQHENIFLYIQKERKSFFGFVWHVAPKKRRLRSAICTFHGTVNERRCQGDIATRWWRSSTVEWKFTRFN